jgi:hypothetical protein
VRFQLAAVITSFVFIAEAFDNPVLQQIVFLFRMKYIFLLGPLCVSTETTLKRKKAQRYVLLLLLLLLPFVIDCFDN